MSKFVSFIWAVKINKIPHRFYHKRAGWFDGNVYLLSIGKWICPFGIFWCNRGYAWIAVSKQGTRS